MLGVHQKYCRETFYNGRLDRFEAVYDDNFNFSYDVIDVIGTQEPGRRAMLWVGDDGTEITFTFGDIKKYTDMAVAKNIGKTYNRNLVFK